MVGRRNRRSVTAVAMIFEMTRDYGIVLRLIIGVAFSLGTRRPISFESFDTLRLARRGHVFPNALHGNMFLVQSAAQIVETDFFVLDAALPFRDPLRSPGDLAFRDVGDA
jgi:chloride channel protein, CIC family